MQRLVRLDIATFPKTHAVKCCHCRPCLAQAVKSSSAPDRQLDPQATVNAKSHAGLLWAVAALLLTAVDQVTSLLQQEGKQRIIHLATWRQRTS